MAQLRQDFAEFGRRETTILVIGPENAAAFVHYFSGHALPFTGLPDPAHTVLDLYGQQINLFKFGRMPAQLLVDKAGWRVMYIMGRTCQISHPMLKC